jgi:hypothetical protein
MIRLQLEIVEEAGPVGLGQLRVVRGLVAATVNESKIPPFNGSKTGEQVTTLRLGVPGPRR